MHNSGQRNVQEVSQEHETSLNKKILECTRTDKENVNKQLCIVTVGGLIIGKFYNKNDILNIRDGALWRRGLVVSSPTAIEETGAMDRETESR
jgi:hypothetical protein